MDPATTEPAAGRFIRPSLMFTARAAACVCVFHPAARGHFCIASPPARVAEFMQGLGARRELPGAPVCGLDFEKMARLILTGAARDTVLVRGYEGLVVLS